MLSIPDVPTFNEWVVLIQQNAVQAKDHVIALKARNKKQGLFADPSLTISIEGYERARLLLITAATDPQQLQHVSRLTRLGQATLGPYPAREEWLTLIKDDPGFAQALYIALQAKQAMFGLQTSQDLLKSIESYASVSGEQKRNGPASFADEIET